MEAEYANYGSTVITLSATAVRPRLNPHKKYGFTQRVGDPQCLGAPRHKLYAELIAAGYS